MSVLHVSSSVFSYYHNCTLTAIEANFRVDRFVLLNTHTHIKHTHASVSGEWVIGLCDCSPASIPIKGLG